MNNNKPLRRFTWAALAGLALACSVGRIEADLIVNRFDTAPEVAQWRFDYGSVTHVESFDATMDANGNALSGSMKVELGFNSTLGGNNKAAYTTDRWFPGMDASMFSSLEMDLKIDPSSAPDAFGNNGYFQLVIRNTDGYTFVSQFGDNVRSADGWRHIVASPLTGAHNAVRALTWELYGGPGQNINGPLTLWVDNIVFVPEPSSWALATLGGLTLLGVWWRRCRNNRRPCSVSIN